MGKPTVVLNVNPDSNTAKGSGRSVAGFNLFEAFDGHRDLMVAFGGHAGAVGMTAKADQLTALQTAFDDAAETQHLTDQPKGQLNVAARLTADKVTMPLYEQLQLLAPFGTDNPVPLFAFDPETLQNVKAIGADGKHLKFKVEDNGQAVDAIDFGQGALAPVLASAPDQVKLLAQIDINVWQGRTNMQLMVKDIAVTGMVVEDKRTQQLHKTMFSEAGTYVFFNQRVYEQLRTQLPPTAVSIVVTAGQEISDQKINTLFLVDCPASIADLQRVLGHITADRIVAYFYLKQSHYLLGMPERAQYAKLFRFVKTHQTWTLANGWLN